MDSLLGNYDSDVEESTGEADEQPRVAKPINVTSKAGPAVPQNQSSLSSSSSTTIAEKRPISSQQPQGPTAKKKKVLDISFLPEHIQRALTSGNSALDSDDEDDMKSSTNSASGPAASARTGRSNAAAADPLLALLPPPEHDKAAALDSMFSFAKPKSDEPRLFRQFTSDPDTKNTTVEDVQEDEDEPLLGPPLSNFGQPLSTQPSQQQFYQPFQSTHQDNEEDFPHQQQQQQPSSASQKKRQQRELEQMLLSGDLSALDGAQAKIQDINVTSEWDAAQYVDQKSKEAAIMRQYTSNGALKSVVLPTKSQNRKHQLTSLAMKAAETEIAMLEASASRGKTKSQTASRYGW